MSRKSERREKVIVSAEAMIAAAPGGNKATYLKLPDKVKLFKPDKGKEYKLIFLPWKAGKGNPAAAEVKWTANRYIFTPMGIGPAEEHYLCPARSYGKPCAVCDQFAHLRNLGKGDEYYKDVLAPLRAKERELWFIHVMDLKGEPENLMIWDESIHLFGNAFRVLFPKRTETRNFSSPDEGCVVSIDAREKKIGNSSCVDCTQGIYIEKRKDPLPEWLEDVIYDCKFCPDKFVTEAPAGKLKSLFTAVAESNGEAGDEEAPAPQVESSRRRRPEPDPVDEELEEAEDDGEVVEVPDKPESRRSRRPEPEPDRVKSRVSTPDPVDEEEETFEDEEDDPIPPPTKSKGRKPA